MKIKVKTGKRGRPLEINVEESLYTLDKYGWRVGNQPMKDWRACVRTWEKKRGRRGLSPSESNAINERLRGLSWNDI